MPTKTKRPRPVPTAFIARDLAAIKVTEGLLMELGFTLTRYDGNQPRWVFTASSPFKDGLPMGYGSGGLELHAGVLESAFKDQEERATRFAGLPDKPVTVLHLLLAAYIAGIHAGSAQAKGRIREAMGL